MTTPALPPGAAESLPPLHVPLRFFATSCAFGVLLGLLWLYEGEAAFSSRYSPTMLAAVHLLTLGVFAQGMFGALFQVVPVLGGGGVPKPGLVATVVHPLLAAGALGLAQGLWSSQRAWLATGGSLLLAAFAVFVPAVGVRLLRSRAPALRPVRLALGAFVVAAGLGVFLATALVWPGIGIVFRLWTNVHAAWGALGFGLLLVIGVSHQVVPMFHVTPPFPPRAVRWPARCVVAGLLALWLPGGSIPGTLALAAGGLWHAVAVLRLLAQRRRRRADATVLGWQIGLVGLCGALVLAAADALVPTALDGAMSAPAREVLLGVLFGLCGLGTIFVGMLTKIVPFLAFLHLQRRAVFVPGALAELPTMGGIVAPRAAFVAVGLHATAGAGAAVAAALPEVGPWAGGAVAASFAWLFGVVTVAALRYRRAVGRLGG